MTLSSSATVAGISGLQLIRLLSLLCDYAIDSLLESRPKSSRLLLDLFQFITFEGGSSIEYLSEDELRKRMRRARDRNDEKPLKEDGASDIALKRSISISNAPPSSGSSTTVDIAGTVKGALPSSGWLAQLDRPRTPGSLGTSSGQPAGCTSVSGIQSDSTG